MVSQVEFEEALFKLNIHVIDELNKLPSRAPKEVAGARAMRRLRHEYPWAKDIVQYKDGREHAITEEQANEMKAVIAGALNS